MLSREVFAQLGAELAHRQKQAMTKEALPGERLVVSALKGIGRGIGSLATKAVTKPGITRDFFGTPQAGRVLSGARAAQSAGGMAAVGGIGYGGYRLGGGGAKPATPATAFDVTSKDPAERFLAAKGDYGRLLAGHQKQIAERKAYEGSEDYNSIANQIGRWLPGMRGYSAEELQAQMDSPTFGKPHTDIGNAAYADMKKQYGELTQRPDMGPLQQKYNQLQAQMKAAPFEAQRAMIGQDMAKLQNQMTSDPTNSQAAKQLRGRMTAMGMPDPWGGMQEPPDLPQNTVPTTIHPGPSYGDYAALAAGNYNTDTDVNAGQIRPGMSGFPQ